VPVAEKVRLLSEAFAFKPGETIRLRSRSRPWMKYEMTVTPEGIGVHLDEGCEGEIFNGPTACWHSKQITERSMTNTSLIKTESALSPVEIAFNAEQLAVIKSTIAKGATDAELQLFVATCKRTGLDPFLRQIYAVKRYDSREKREVMAIQVGIDGLQLIAERTGRYAGMDDIEYLDEQGVWSSPWTGAGANPVAARTRVYRKDFDRPIPATVRWDSYAQTYRSDNKTKLMPTWERMPDVMLGKCALALALRRAFPAEMSGFAAAVDPDYDFEAEQAELRQAGQHDDAIEGQVVPPRVQADGASEQNQEKPADVAANVHGEEQQGETNPTPPTSNPAATPPAPNYNEQYQTQLADIIATLTELEQTTDKEYFAGVVDGIKERWKALVGQDNRIYAKRAKLAETPEILAYLREKRDAAVGAPPDTPDVCDHEPRYNQEGTVMTCAKCGAVLEDTREPAANQAPLID
jgi:phage recombination protein Bet